MKPVNTKDENYFLIQTLIFIAPALISTLLFNIEENFPPIQEFTAYRCGISGIVLLVTFSSYMSISEDLAAILVFFIYCLIFLVFYVLFFYSISSNNKKKTKLIFTWINTTLAVWGILSGAFAMFASGF